MVIKPCFAKKCNIVEDDGARVRFHPVCPKCGEVMRNCIESGHCSNGQSNVGHFTCNRGCPAFPVELQRG